MAAKWHTDWHGKKMELTIQGESAFDDRTGKGFLTFFITDVKVSDPDTGKPLGSIKYGLDGSIWLFHEELAPRGIYISSREVWRAFTDALESGPVE